MKYFPFFIFGILISYLVFMVFILSVFPSEVDKNLEKTEQGKASKINYQGHRYVVWSINFGGGITHDPDCQCMHKVIE